MRTGKYTIRELFTDRAIERIIIPEIQRDYVWGSNEVKSLLVSIYESFDEYQHGLKIDTFYHDKDLQESFELYIKRQKLSCNIGFIYAYTDPEFAGNYFLIDGQQRLTTIYLLLLVLSGKVDGFKDVFDRLYTVSGYPFIDYRVRESAKKFFRELLSNYKADMNIVNQIWFYDDYKYDKTIMSVVYNIECISAFIKDNQLNNSSFCEYLQDYIDFWYFDTSVSTQGEELYIYMNARGEQMQENENLKADLLEQLYNNDSKDLKTEWGKKWEGWQDFFWSHRGKNVNADKGFNEFINCIAGAENNRSDSVFIYKQKIFDSCVNQHKNGIPYPVIKKCFSADGLSTVEKYYKSLSFFFNQSTKDNFNAAYPNSNWYYSFLIDVILLFNNENTNWFADVSDVNRSKEINRMVFMWSVFYYMTHALDNEQPVDTIFRCIRLLYVRYKNYDRSIKKVYDFIDDVLNKGIYEEHKNYDTEDEQLKHTFLRSINEKELKAFEEAIWEIEDHPLNIDGRDLNAINSMHLIDYTSNPSLNELRLIKAKFYSLFPLNDKGALTNENNKKIINLLLFYGLKGEQVSPWYCYNYYFGNFSKIIRNIGDMNKPFQLFFIDYSNTDLDTLYNSKVQKPTADFTLNNLNEALQWYAARLGESMWTQGLYIVYEHDAFPSNDHKFTNMRQLVNSKGDLRGGTPRVLSALLH